MGWKPIKSRPLDRIVLVGRKLVNTDRWTVDYLYPDQIPNVGTRAATHWHEDTVGTPASSLTTSVDPEALSRTHLPTTEACQRLGAWLSAALDDPNAGEAFKADVRAWFEAGGDGMGASAMAAFGASDAACYHYPGEHQQAERAAFCHGAEYAGQEPTTGGGAGSASVGDEGFVLAPREPTEAMLEAGRHAYWEAPDQNGVVGIPRAYAAMLAAAPQVEGEG